MLELKGVQVMLELKVVRVMLEFMRFQYIDAFPDPDLVSKPGGKTPNTTSCLVHARPGHLFRVKIVSHPQYQAAPVSDSYRTLRIEVLIDGKLEAESPDLDRKSDGGFEYVIGKELEFPSAVGPTSSIDPAATDVDKNLRQIVVQVIPCRDRAEAADAAGQDRPNQEAPEFYKEVIERLRDDTLTFIFKYRTLVEIKNSLSPNDGVAHWHFVEMEQKGILREIPMGEYDICCGRILHGASADSSTGRIPHTGIIVCSNEFCQVPGQAWHKGCAGMELWEEPEGLWFCPDCRQKPRVEMEVEIHPSTGGVVPG